MKEKIKIKTNNNTEIEEEIVRTIQKKAQVKQIPVVELEKMILEEIDRINYLSGDWQKHYAKERIKEKIIKEVFNFFPTTWRKRFLHLILDTFGYSILLVVFINIFRPGVEGLFFGIIIVESYYIIFESIWAKTPAKFITGTRVITKDGEKPNFQTILIRTLIRNIPFEAFTFLNSRPRGLHDDVSQTIVVDDKDFPKRHKTQ